MPTLEKDMPPISAPNLNAWSILLLLFPLTAYIIIVYLYSSDGPLYEDHEGLAFLIDYYDANSFTEKLKALLLQATDHRPLTGYLTFLAQYKVLGHGSYLGIIYLGNILVIGIACLHIYHFLNTKAVFLISLIVFYLSFQLIPIGHMYWAGSAISGSYVFFFSYLSLILLCKQTFWHTVLASLCALWSIYSLTNGLALLPAALFLLLMTSGSTPEKPMDSRPGSSQKPLNRNYLIKQLIFFEIISLIAAYAYFSGYNQDNAVGSIVDKLSNPDILDIGGDTIRLLGSGFTYGIVSLQYAAGITAIILCLWLFHKSYHKQQPALAAYMVFLVGSIFAICLGRTSWWLLDVDANQSRYFFLSMQVWVVLSISFADLYFSVLLGKSKFLVWGAITTLVLSFIASYAINVNRVVEFCWNKKLYSYEQIARVNQQDDLPLTGGRMGHTYDHFVKVAMERGYFNTDSLFSDTKPVFFNKRMACYVKDAVK